MTCCIDDLYCAETVLKEIAEKNNISSPLIPRIATGLCSGMARTNGPCGALTGGILALNLMLGRDDKTTSVERNYAAVQELTEKFNQAHGSLHCSELLGCDLSTPEGQRQYNEQNLGLRCNELSQSCITLVNEILEQA
ncbi:MAG: C-GCAxxG-C-C family protein [Gammaproteobacteria bacterium]|nr:C-GCAxxG-C-C family protein [Gammaproteobacteria bacterium]